MRVNIEGDRDLRVAQPLLDHLRGDAVGEEDRRVGVAQVLQRDARELRRLHVPVERSGERPGPEWGSILAAEDEPAVLVGWPGRELLLSLALPVGSYFDAFRDLGASEFGNGPRY